MTWASSNNPAPSGIPLRTLLAALLVVVCALIAVHRATDGFRVVTTEDARRLSLEEHPRRLPDTLIEYESGRALPLIQALREDGRVTIAVFIYTRCNAVCSVMGTEFQQLQDTIHTRGLGRQVRLLSISFDGEDGQEELARYARRMRAQADGWRFARVADARQRGQLLDAFGITVVPAPLGEFQHNAAFHILTPDGRLTRIVDYDRPEQALAYALAAARNAVPGSEAGT